MEAEAGSDFSSSVAVTSIGTFCDVQAFFTTSAPATQSGEYIKAKQFLSITVPGRNDSVRVNCLDQFASFFAEPTQCQREDYLERNH